MRALRRVAVALVLTAPLLIVAPSPAEATQCGYEQPPLPPAYYPCFGPDDQPVGAPVWATTEFGPGWEYMHEWRFIKILQGGHIILANAAYPTAIRFHGNGFDSGYLTMGQAADVAGVPSLAPGHYAIYNEIGSWTGDLFVEAPCVTCPIT